ncbi:MAG: hemolysin family protein [Saprospiraceae bacterium]|nr:HlyC/CorC family transporter [Saprospiraceae bacterium]
MELVIIIILILINGIFSLAEMSLVSSRRFKLETASKKGMSGAKTAIELSENPTKFLSTVQIGITLIGILLGVFSGENLTHTVAEFLGQFSLLNPYAHQIAVGIIVILVTYLSIVFGELLPKRIGMTFPEPIAMVLAKPMKFVSLLTSPFVWLLMSTNDLFLKILGIRKSNDSNVSEEEIKSLIKEGTEGGEIQDIEHQIVERVFELGDRKVDTLFTHRNELVYFNEDETLQSITAKINQEKHSAYPVCKNDDIDEIIGIALLKDLFMAKDDQHFSIKNFIKPAIFINESSYAYKVLEIFKKERMHYGIVVDEYGSTAGMVTMDDVVDALVGDVTENYQSEYEIVKRNENSWLVDGQYSLLEFAKFFELDIDDNVIDSYNTVAGLIISQKDQLPNVGDTITIDQLQIEVLDKDGQRIDKLLVTKM